MWFYAQSTGDVHRDEQWEGIGYSGRGSGRNNPDAQEIPSSGPIPRGVYRIGVAYDDPHLGPCVMHLDPEPGTNTFDRTDFRMHGNNKLNDASKGCVVAGPSLRHLIASSQDRLLTVTP